MSEPGTTPELARPPEVAPDSPPSPAAPRGPLELALAFLGSYGLAVVLLLLLCLLVYLGTIEQVDLGLYEAQKRYFGSAFLVHRIELDERTSLPIPLPGVHLLLGLLSLNLLVGGLVRLRKTVRTLGVLIAHVGIALLLLAGMVTFWFSEDGHLTLVEGASGARFKSYHEWELALFPVDPAGTAVGAELVVGDAELRRARPGHPMTFHHPELPLELRVDAFAPNSRPRRRPSPLGPPVDGWALHELPLEKEAELNVAGVACAALVGGQERAGVVWGFEHPRQPAFPWVLELTGGARWAVELRRREIDLPFTIRLEDFSHEYHPGTGVARNYQSRVTMVEDGVAQELVIRMNEPLRHRGYTLFQSSFGPPDARPGDPGVWSTFAVVRNPSDHVPIAACVVIGAGLLLHFVLKLGAWIRSQEARRERGSA